MEKLSWMFELLDRMSGPADRIAKSLKKLDPSLKSNTNQTSLFSRMIGGVARTFGPRAASAVLRFAGAAVNLGSKLKVLSPVVGALGKIGSVAGKGILAAGAAMVAIGTAAAVAIGGMAVAGGRFVANALVFKEDSLTAFEAILGSKTEAEKVMAQATKFASKTPFKTSEVVDMAKALLTRGFKADELEKLMMGVGDVGAMLGTEKMDSVVNALGKMRANGKMTGETMAMLADAGINSQLVFGSLGKTLGKSKDELENLMSAGKITDAQGIAAVMDAIKNGLSGGELGGAMDKKSRTMSGLLSTLESVPEELVFSANMSGLIDPLKLFITQLTTALSPDSANGKQVIAMLERIGGTLGGIVKDLAGADLAGTFAKILAIAAPLVDVFVSFGKGIFSGAGKVLSGILEQLEKMDPKSVGSMAENFGKFGQALGMALGLVVVFVGAMVGLEMKIIDWGTSFIQTVSAVIAWFSNLHATIAGTFDGLGDFGTLLGELVVQGLIAMTGPLGMAVFDMLSLVKALFTDADWGAVGMEIISGLIRGLMTLALGPLPGAIASVVDIVKNGFTSGLQIGSPSKVSEGYGADTGQGYINGLTNSGIGASLTDLLKMPAVQPPAVAAVQTVAKAATDLGSGGDTGTTGGGFFGNLGQVLPFLGGPMALPGMVAAAGGASGSTGGTFASLANALSFISPAASTASLAANAIQPAAAAGPEPATQPARPGANIDLSGMPPIQIIVHEAAQAAEAGKQAAESFTTQLGASLKGFFGESGG